MHNISPFHLETAILAWRSALASTDDLRESDLDELESHIRDSVADLQGRGLSEHEAFTIATQRLGGGDVAEAIGREHPENTWARRGRWMLFGVLGYHVLSAFYSIADSLVTALAVWLTRDVTAIRWIQIGFGGITLLSLAWVLAAVVRGRIRAPFWNFLRPFGHPAVLVGFVLALYVAGRLIKSATQIFSIQVMTPSQYGNVAVYAGMIDLVVLGIAVLMVPIALAVTRRRAAA